MGVMGPVETARLVCGVMAVSDELLERAQQELSRAFSEIDLAGDVFPFDFTDYYEEEMGSGLLRRFVAFAGCLDPSTLADTKLRTNAIEESFAESSGGRMCRRVNLDPGYVTPAKFVLATTKNFAHRVYLRDGIYAEITALFRHGKIVPFEWTYPDIRSGRYDAFLLDARKACLT